MLTRLNAVRKREAAVRRARAGLQDENRPFGLLLYLRSLDALDLRRIRHI